MSNKDHFHSKVLTREADFSKCILVVWLFFSPAFFTFVSHLIKMAQESLTLLVRLPTLRTRKYKLL